MDGREEIPSGTPTKSSTTSLGSFVSMDEPSAFRGQNREPSSESRMREKRLSGSMSREEETEPRQTGLRRHCESTVNSHRKTTATAPVLDSTQIPLARQNVKSPDDKN